MLFCGYKAALALGIDDLHPESSREGVDCGGDLEKGSLGMLEEFLSRYDMKATLFLTPYHIFRPQFFGLGKAHKMARLLPFSEKIDVIFSRLIRRWDSRFNLMKDDNRAFIEYLKELISKGMIEVGIHGLFHFSEIPPYAMEFLKLDDVEAERRIRLSLDIIASKSIPFVKGFAPPGWGVNKGLLRALILHKFLYIAGSADFITRPRTSSKSREHGLKGVPLLFPCVIGGKLVNIPRNWTPHRNSLHRALRILELGGLLGIQMHVENSYHDHYLGNGITEGNLKKLGALIDTVENRFGRRNVWFTTFSGIARNFISQASCESLT